MRNSLNPEHPSYDETVGFTTFVLAMKVEPEAAFAVHAKSCLRADMITYLKNKFPRSDFESTENRRRQ